MDLKASPIPPDLLVLLEKGFRDPDSVIPLSEEAASRYKKIVGKLSWWCQSRPDHARFISLLATGQSQPTKRRYLRFFRSNAHLFHRFPSESTSIPFYDGLIGVSDASWGSSEFVEGCCIGREAWSKGSAVFKVASPCRRVKPKWYQFARQHKSV